MSTIYINLRDDKSFHTIIIKKKIKEFTYLASIGYAGGGVYEEFFGKLKDEYCYKKSKLEYIYRSMFICYHAFYYN